MYAVKCPNGEWLDNEYTRRRAKTNKMRLYTSPVSARISLGRVSSPLVGAPERPVGQWTEYDRNVQAAYWKFLVGFNKKLSTEEYWKLRKAEGYELVEVQVQVL